jgi:hypothetical protein
VQIIGAHRLPLRRLSLLLWAKLPTGKQKDGAESASELFSVETWLLYRGRVLCSLIRYKLPFVSARRHTLSSFLL